MTVINTNVGALQARVASLGAQTNMEKAMQRLSSGLRINSAADDAAGLAVATKMESQLRGINMAIRNSNDGISLVQTAESGMAEISNMVIRMRELAVQMNNGIYSDGDRSNAQLEVNALLAEIDKISNNTAFNGVKVLDGTYAQDIRAGNTNPEVINVKIDRMNTDTLGGVAISLEEADAVDTSTIYVHGAAKTTVTAQEGQVKLSKEQFNVNFREFTIANAGGAYSVTGTDASKFSVNAVSGEITVATGELDFDNPADANRDNKYHFEVHYTAGGETVTEQVELTVTDRAAVTASSTTGTSNLSVTEAENIKFTVAGPTGALSDAFKEFVSNDNGLGTTTASYSISGTDTTSELTLNLDALTGLAATDDLNFSIKVNGSAETVVIDNLTAGEIATSDALGAKIAAADTSSKSFDFVYETSTNTIIARMKSASDTFSSTATDNQLTVDQDGGGNTIYGTVDNNVIQMGIQAAGNKFTIDSTTGEVSSVTGAIDFENPVDNGYDNKYDFTVTYTDSYGKTFAESVQLTVLDDTSVDVSTASTSLETSTTGSSDINISKTNTDIAYFDLNDANHRDLLSQGAKDFIKRHAGDNVDALNEVFGFVNITGGTVAAGQRFEVQSATSTTATTDLFTTDVNETITSAAINVGTVPATNDVFTLVLDDSRGTATTLTTRAATSATDLNTLTKVVDALKQDADYANLGATLTVNAAGNAMIITYDEGHQDIADTKLVTFTKSTGTTTNFDNGGLDGDTTAGGTAIGSFQDGAGAPKIGVGTGAATGTVLATITLRENATDGEVFTETVTINVTQNGAAGTDTFVGGMGRTEQTGASTILTGTSNGEALALNLTDRALFTDMRTYFDAHNGGTFTLLDKDGNAYTKLDDGDALDSEGSQVSRGFSISGNVLTLDAGADAGVYEARVRYTDREGKVFTQQIHLTTTESSNKSTDAAVLTSSSQIQSATATSTELTGAKSVLEVAEARKGKIASVGQNSQLSAELGQFVGRYPKGTWSLSGADAANFSIDKNGNVESRVLMNYEEKQSHSFNVVYTSGDISYSEQITLNVVNNTADDGDHIANVDVGTQAGAADAISILNNALNSITASQAKLGSIQNRLQHNIDNLTALSSQTEIARGRITDADYAAETSQLSKQQILSQAATSMLAQANQSKQGVLALLQ